MGRPAGPDGGQRGRTDVRSLCWRRRPRRQRPYGPGLISPAPFAPTQPQSGARLQDLPLVDGEGSGSDVELSDEDLDFVQEHARSLGFLEKLNQKDLDK